MTNPPEIFDRALLRARRKKAVHTLEAVDYLLKYAHEDIMDRLSVIMREFPLTLNLGAHHGDLSHRLRELTNITDVYSLDSVMGMVEKTPPPRINGDEELLPFAAESLDLVVSALSLQFVNDLPGTLLQIRQCLKADGALIAALLGGESLTELRHVFLMAEEELYGGVSPRVAPFADVRDMGHLLQRAGFALPVTDRDVLKVRFNSATHLMKELQAMGASNVLSNRSRHHNTKILFERVNELYTEHYSDDDGRVYATFELIYLMGWAPHPDQQKPLRPGSGTVNLKDVFGK
jgi:SAM-dependent methyltransferase